MNLREAFLAIEEYLVTQNDRELKKLLSYDEMSTEALHTARGRAQAFREAHKALRDRLGYDPSSL